MSASHKNESPMNATTKSESSMNATTKSETSMAGPDESTTNGPPVSDSGGSTKSRSSEKQPHQEKNIPEVKQPNQAKNVPEVKQPHRAGMLVFSVIFFLVCLLPFAGLLFAPTNTSSDADSLSAPPALTHDDGTANLEFLSEVGSYFEDHFAFRTYAIDLNARIKAGLLKTSPTEQVIVGEDGWLYYGGTLADYQGLTSYDEREIKNIVHNLEIMQGYTEAQGASFILLVAPNKNSLYPEHMPYYLEPGSNDNWERLKVAFDESSINYVDAFALFGKQQAELYYKTDTHWTTEGALLVGNALLEAADKQALELQGAPTEGSITGDLALMLYPKSTPEEPSHMLDTGEWSYEGAATTVEEGSISTAGEGEGTLLMFRDSFANTLIPLMAPAFEEAHFSKMIPFNFTEIASLQADTVILERAERQIGLLGEEAPFLLAPSIKLDTQAAGTHSLDAAENSTELSWSQNGDFRVIEGWIDGELMETESEIYLEIDGPSIDHKVFVPFYLTSPNGAESSIYGFKLCLDEHSLTEGSYRLKVLVSSEGTESLQVVFDQNLQY